MINYAKLQAELKGSTTLPSMPKLASPPKCVIDYETFSECDLKDCGAVVYAQHPSTEILCMSWRLPHMTGAKIWVPGREPFPQEILDHIAAGGVIEAHNAGFERAIWKYVLMPWKNLPDPKQDIPWPGRWKDTMATCAYRALPLDLEDVGNVLNLTTKKDRRGKDLIRILCKPQKPTKKRPERRRRDPELLEELYAYCIRDTDTEWELGERIGDLPFDEYRIWVLDQKINNRGVYVDTDAIHAALNIVEIVENRLEKRLAQLTCDRVTGGSEVAAIKDWLMDRGYGVSDLTADTVERMLDDKNRPHKLPDDVREVLKIRQTLSKASTKKLFKYLYTITANGRIQYLLQYHGASTGRWAGRGVQPQNFPRGEEFILAFATGEADEEGMNLLIEHIKRADPDILILIYGDAMEAIASSLRGMIVAEPGNRLYVSDFSAIEARVTAWLFGEEWKLDAFIAVDEGKGYKGSADMYLAAGSMVFGYPCLTKKSHPKERQVGKMCELAFGYQGGVGAWRKFDPRQPGDEGYVEDEQVNEYKQGWRDAHPCIVAGWWGLENAAIQAVLTGKPQYYAKVTYETVTDAAGFWLTCILPNGRRLWYYKPEVEEWEDQYGRKRQTLSYEGKDNKRGGSWGRIETYGGSLTENVVQAISRDLMVEAMIRVEAVGYTIILTVHDEIIAEVPLDFGSAEEFDRLMTVVPIWAEGCPIHASGWTGIRYHKE